MKKLVVIMVAAVLLSACQTAPKEQAKAKLQCTFPDAADVMAPGWVCDEPVEGVEVYAVGIYEKTAAGLQFQRDQAVAAARVSLAQQMRVHVQNMIKQYAETTGAASSETVDKVNTSVSKVITAETLEGSRLLMSKMSPRGTMYVLVGFDPQLTKKKAADVLKTSMKNDQALWQQFKAKQGQEELAADIAKISR
jgi:hypothetical protein